MSKANQISTARGRESGSAVRSNALGDGREVSRGHSTGDENRGAGRRPCKQRTDRREIDCLQGSPKGERSESNPQARSGKDRTGSMIRPVHPSTAMNPTGGARHGDGLHAENRSEAEIDCRQAARRVSEANQREIMRQRRCSERRGSARSSLFGVT